VVLNATRHRRLSVVVVVQQVLGVSGSAPWRGWT
jgi:hypothetical protein